MNIPPFPAQELAKLVLGYLAEQQLMTAYDEFLQSSPYLDAYENEYERILMTSLKNIVAEYRAVKIYVENCKPVHLRRRLLECCNLLEMVKFLICHIDITKIQKQEYKQNKFSFEANKSTKISSYLSRGDCEDVALDSAVEATSLSDLPGNQITTRKKTGLDGNVIDSNTVSNSSSKLLTSNMSYEKPPSVNNLSSMAISGILKNNDPPQMDVPLTKHTDPLQVRGKEDFIHINNQVCHKDQSGSTNLGVNNQNLMDGYKHFTTGVTASGNSGVSQDSSTEQMYVRVPVSIESGIISNTDMIKKTKQIKTQYLLKVAPVNNHVNSNEVLSITTTNNSTFPLIKPKTDDTKVKILSDVKVDNNDAIIKMPPVLKNATSTPLLHMKTIFINGTPVFRQNAVDNSLKNFTKDEIMAMPTIILAPAPGPPPIVCSVTNQNSNLPTDRNKTSTAQSMCPLTIDLVADTPEKLNKDSNQTEADKNRLKNVTIGDSMPKTTDITSASAPKDNSVAGIAESNTPQMLPPLRKSSSTPRRTSHVRVLDFTTPRRILHETVNKFTTTVSDTDTVLSKINENDTLTTTSTDTNNDKTGVDTEMGKDDMKNIKLYEKKGSWDADLRALAVIPESSVNVFHSPNTTLKSKTAKKKRTSKTSLAKKENDSQSSEKQVTKKRSTKRSAKKQIEPELSKDIETENTVPVKPTFNIITGVDRRSTEAENDKNQIKSDHDKIDTPELERMSLQNEIGAKLNISDLLETPYKQALYDIQMETPRFLGPDIPGDPMSDIKIMNIPTPKFLNAPTPSSYSSRPTDYSSGGSYYKPDDQDYMRIADDFVCPGTSPTSKEKKKIEKPNGKEVDTSNIKDQNSEKPLRPVRQCRKNVSYYKNIKEAREADNKTEFPCSSDMSDNSFCDTSVDKDSKQNNKENKNKSTLKSITKLVTKKQKTPIKKEFSKSFMKIRPRRITPTKKDDGRRKKKTPESCKGQGRKKITRKQEDNVSAPVIVSAPTKSRRKSSTPRKLHCTKSFNLENSGHVSPELLAKTKNDISELNTVSIHDSDTEQLPLRWSDDGSQDVKAKEIESNTINESEDINKIQEYLKNTTNNDDSKEGCLHIDLVKRGFDLATAKIIERELLDTSPQNMSNLAVNSNTVVIETKSVSAVCAIETKNDIALEKTLESDCSTSNNLQIIQDDEEEVEEVELSVHESNEDTSNFFSYNHDDTKHTSQKELSKLKDKFSMEVCLDDDLSIRLRATLFTILLDQEPDENLLNYNEKETEMAVRSISNISKLYTPLKESMKAQCYDIFDSTLTSLDTPLKAKSPKIREEVTITEIVLEVENIGDKEKSDTKKRKRAQSENMSDDNEPKKSKPEAQYLLNSANIQNIDIESVLSKLHGP